MNFYQRMGILPLKKARKSWQMQFHDKTVYVWGLRYRWDPLLSMKPVRRLAHFMLPWAFVISLGWLVRDSWSVEIKFSSKLLVEYLILCAVGSQQCAQSPDLRIHKRNKNMTRNQQVPTLIILWKFSDRAWFQRIFIQNFYSIVTKFHGFGLLCLSLFRCPSFENHV